MEDIKNHYLGPLGFFIPLFLACLGSLFIGFPVLSLLPVSTGNSAEFLEIPSESDIKVSNETNIHFLAASNRKTEDLIQKLYHLPESKSRVIEFFAGICPSKEIAEAILTSADFNNIPPALALSLAWEESRLNPLAVNSSNRDGSIDRGLFQLNNRSFPKLDIQAFFDPVISAKYGMSHLRHCLNTGGTEIAALAMYNAGTGKVRNNGTPKTTLDYIHRILENRQEIERRFLEKEAIFQQELENAVLLASETTERRLLVPLMPLAGMR